ncbi:ornithine decarboxylase [Aspergillus lentulus]|uniref:Ornithine decarboxylase n=1 Tax=Aspergillus lentulus TaxID=293939 RepID=A0AAN4T6Z8_ASPLE|nr:ornithine decarboxylase [Aspergillus lentulus]
MDSTERLIDLAIQTRLLSLSSRGWGIADEPFFVADLGQVIRQHRRWRVNLPDVHPFFGVCPPPSIQGSDIPRLDANSDLGTGFDCASIEELRTVLSLGVDSCRIIFANPCKSASSLVFAARTGVTRTTFDNLDELDTIRTFLPNAQLVLRIFASDSDALIDLGEKFGATVESSLSLLQRARELGLDVCGVSFHVGTGASNTSAYVNAIRHAKIVFGYGKSLGFDMKLLDIGGGFQDCNLEDIACSLRPMLKEEFPPGVRLIAEPGRYYARSAYTLVCKILSRRRHIGTDDHDKPDMLYQNDGVYGSFMNVLIEKETVRPSLVAYTWPFHSHDNDTRRKLQEHRYTIWGPTCDSVDCVAKDVPMNSEIRIGDWLKYKNMGAYTTATATQFNGFSNQHDVIYINTESMDYQAMHWKALANLHQDHLRTFTISV